jgi:hypothetical protein
MTTDADASCPQCHSDVDADSRFCKNCAFDLRTLSKAAHSSAKALPDSVPKTSRILLLLLIVGGIMGFLLILYGVTNRQRSSSGESTSSSSISFSDRSLLTSERASKAINKWADSAKSFGCQTEPCTVKIDGGVREIPQQNAAVAELSFIKFVYQPSDEQNQLIYSGRGTATFSRYTDGRWVLTEIRIGDIYSSRIWKPQIEAE